MVGRLTGDATFGIDIDGDVNGTYWVTVPASATVGITVSPEGVETDVSNVTMSDLVADVNNAPVPRWDLINFNDYSTMCVQYSRGCPYDCEFCDITVLFGHRPRIKRPDLVLAELDALYESGWRGGVFFIDDNFFLHYLS